MDTAPSKIGRFHILTGVKSPRDFQQHVRSCKLCLAFVPKGALNSDTGYRGPGSKVNPYLY